MIRLLDGRAIIAALFLPLLFWTGSVISISMMGYPGIICMTPLAWLLALPVGLRIRRESSSPGRQPAIEAAVAGALLGLFQGLLFTGVVVSSPHLLGMDMPNPLLSALASLLPGVPVTAALSAAAVWFRPH